MSISVELLWSNDPLPINEIIENPTVVVNLPIGGTIITSNVTQSYVDDQDALLQDQINTKLDASEYNQHFKGVYVDLAALQIAIPTANDGDYAHIDLGVGSDREVAIWDNDDAIWVASTGSVASTTDEVAEGSTNRYFTETRVRATPLTGFTPSPNSPVLSTDQLLAAIGKLQAQINNSPSPTWVNISTLAGYTKNANVSATNFKVQVAKINGMIWMRGHFTASGNSSANPLVIFSFSQSSYLIDSYVNAEATQTSLYTAISTPLMTLGAQSTMDVVAYRTAGVTTSINFFKNGLNTGVTNRISPICLGSALSP